MNKFCFIKNVTLRIFKDKQRNLLLNMGNRTFVQSKTIPFNKTQMKSFTASNDENQEELLVNSNLDKVDNKIAPFLEKPLENKEQEESTLKQEGMPFIQYSHPILPFTQIINKNFNRKELLFNLALKYGKITQIDDETTQIDDIVLYFDKEDNKKINKDEGFNFGILCQIKVKKNNYFVVEGLNKILQVKSTIGFGKYRFFKPHHATEINPSFTNSEEYYITSNNHLKDIIHKLDFIKSVLNYEGDNFGNMNLKFNFDIEEIKSYVKSTEDKLHTNVDFTAKEVIYQEYFFEIYKFISYFVMKLNFFKTTFFQTEFDFNKYFQTKEIIEKLAHINGEMTTFSEFLELKYEKYKFKFNYQLNFENPFVKTNEDDVKRLVKYKLSLEHKISN